jgi:hypothetical protein
MADHAMTQPISTIIKVLEGMVSQQSYSAIHVGQELVVMYEENGRM